MSALLNPRTEGRRTDTQSCGHLGISAKPVKVEATEGELRPSAVNCRLGTSCQVKIMPLVCPVSDEEQLLKPLGFSS